MRLTFGRHPCFFVVVLIAAMSGSARADVWCKTTMEPGKPIDGRFMGVSYLMIGHVLAEQYCGAASLPIKPKILAVVKKLGCSPGTEIYDEVEMSLSRPENLDLAHLAGDGSSLELSRAEIRRWAEETTEMLGGCSALVKTHNSPD